VGIDPSTVYPDTDNDGGVGAPAGTSATFTLHNTGATAATKFVANLDIPPALVNTPANEVVTATGNTGQYTVSPAAPGPHTLYVAALDAAGDASSTEGYDFTAAGHGNPTCASLTACFNNTAISADSAMNKADMDGAGNSFSATDLTAAGWASAGKVNVNGAMFALPAYGSGQPDNVLAANQTVAYDYTVPLTGISSLEFLTASSYGHEAAPASADDNATTPYLPAGVAVAGHYCFDSVHPEAYCTAYGTITYTRGNVLTLNGTDAGASTAGPVLTTSGSYSVSAWARLTSTAATATVAAENGTANAAFALQYNKTYNAWTFTAAGSDSATPASTPHVSASAAPALNTWTHLVGTYTAATHVMSLYVNGTLAGTASDTTPWNATGTFDIGHSGTGAYFPGSLSDVQAWDYTVTAQQVTALHKQVS
jgi:hypothetical protein